jgi:hypothetical protein
MSYKTTSNVAQVNNEFENKVSLALRFMLEDIHKISLVGTPMRYGNLRADVLKQVQRRRGTIAWTKNYASKMERKQFTHYTTPGTGPKFAEGSVRIITEMSDQYWRRVGLK